MEDRVYSDLEFQIVRAQEGEAKIWQQERGVEDLQLQPEHSREKELKLLWAFKSQRLPLVTDLLL